MFKDKESQKQDVYTEDEVNELAEWFEDLTLKQAFFLKESYENYLKMKAHTIEGAHYVH